MNNRIMAMLFALVAAMFISIVPVKAEAAACNHAKFKEVARTESTCSAVGYDKHIKCDDCNRVFINNVWTYDKSGIEIAKKAHNYSEAAHDALTHWTKCSVCGEEKPGTNGPHTNNWTKDASGHSSNCAGCNIPLLSHEQHTFTYVKDSADAQKHVRTCSKCGYSDSVAHVDDFVNSSGAAGKDCKCDLCGTQNAHDFTTYGKEANGHYGICSKCGAHDVFANHTLTWTKSAEKHSAVCSVCEMACVGESDHAFKYVDNKDQTHTRTCDSCKYTDTVAHVDEYKNDTGAKGKDCKCDKCGAALEHVSSTWVKGDAGHSHKCEKCDAVYGFEKHTYSGFARNEGAYTHGEACTVCGKTNAATPCKATKDPCYCDDCGGLMRHGFEAKDIMRRSATCTTDGFKAHYVHAKCGNVFEQVNGEFVLSSKEAVKIPATGHTAGKAWFADETNHFRLCETCYAKKGAEHAEVKIESTIEAHEFEYTALGNKRHQATCKICGYEPDPADHDFAAPVHTIVGGKDAHKQICNTCKKEVEVYCEDKNGDCVCDVCGTLKIHDITPLSTQKGKDATCTAAGVKTHYKCNTCKNIFSYDGTKCTKITAQDTVIPALGHKWVAKGTDIADGKHVMKCDNAGCNKYTVKPHYTEDGDCYCDVAGCKEIAHSHKHVYVAEVPATCTEEGTEAYYYYQGCGRKFDLNEREISAPVKIPAAGHDYGDEWIPCEDGIHAKFCANCDAFLSEEHNFANGNVLCTVCGGEEDLTHVPAVAATCTQNGNVEYWTSLITGKKYADEAGTRLLTDVTVKATGHDMSGWEDMANGLGHKQVCMNGCGHELVENHDNVNGCFCTECGGFKTGHSNEMVEAVPATCAKAGTQAHFKCSCGKLYDLGFNAIEKAGSIAQLKHDMGTQVLKDAKEGKHYVQCKNCTYRMYEKHGMELSDPNKGNYHQWLCDCGELKIETHYDKNGDKKCDVCGHNMNGASQNTTVEQHDNQTVHTGQSSSVNTTKDWWWNWQEWFTPSNSGGSSATVTESAPESNTANSGAATGNTTTNNTTTNNAASNNTTTNNTTTNNSGNTTTPTVSAPAASETGVIAQFITWFLGLFGF